MTLIRRASFITTAGIVRYLAQALLLVLISRLLGPSDAGIYALAIAITGPIFVISSLGLRTVALTLFSEVSDISLWLLRVVSSASGILISVLIGTFVSPEVAIAVALVAAAKFIDSAVDLSSALMQRDARFAWIMGYASANAVVSLSSAAVGFALGRSLPAVLSGFVAGALLVTLVVMVITRGSVRIRTRASVWIEMALIIRAGLPIGIANGALVFVQTIPQYLLALWWSEVSVAQFAVALYVLTATEIVLNGVAQTWLTDGRRLHAQGQLTLTRLFRIIGRVDLVVVPIGLCGLAGAYIIFPLMFGPALGLTLDLIPPLILGIIALPFVFMTAAAMAIANQYTRSVLSALIALIVVAGICWVTIPVWGVAGAFWAYSLALLARATSNGILFKFAPTSELKGVKRE